MLISTVWTSTVLSSSIIPVDMLRAMNRSTARSLYQAFSPMDERSEDTKGFSTVMLAQVCWPPNTSTA